MQFDPRVFDRLVSSGVVAEDNKLCTPSHPTQDGQQLWLSFPHSTSTTVWCQGKFSADEPSKKIKSRWWIS